MLLDIKGSLGDEVIFTAAIREYSRCHPEERLVVKSKFPELLLHNPYVGVGMSDNGVAMSVQTAPPYDMPGTIAHFYGNQLGIKILDTTPDLFLTNEEKSLYPKRDNVVVIDTWAGWPNRRWPLDRFKSLVDMLHERGMRVIEVGKSTKDCFGQVRHPPLPNVDESLVDKQSVREMAALLFSSRLYIGNESGLVHLSEAVGTPQVVLYSNAVSWWTRSYKDTFVIHPLDDCKACRENSICKCERKGKFCMEEITPQDVITMCNAHDLITLAKEALVGAGPLDRLCVKPRMTI